MHGLPPTVLAMADAAGATLSRRDLIAMGFATTTVDRWARAGLLERTNRGEFRVCGSDRPLRQVLATTLWRAGPGARIAGPLNLALRGVEGFALSATDHIAIPPARRVRGVGFRVVRTPLPSEDHDLLDGLPAMTATRSLIAAAKTNREARIVHAYYWLRRAGATSADLVSERAEALGNAYGAPQMRRIIRSGALRHESPREHDLARLFQPPDPQPAVQVWVTHRGRWYRFDFAFLDARLALEYDGKDHEERREQDADRDLAMMELQVITIRVTNAMMRDPADTRRRILKVRSDRLQLGLPPLVPQRPPWA